MRATKVSSNMWMRTFIKAKSAHADAKCLRIWVRNSLLICRIMYNSASTFHIIAQILHNFFADFLLGLVGTCGC